jgi:alkylation response protein AidB-like acyl-CoA dehydrogenase
VNVQFEPSSDHKVIRDSFRRFLETESSIARVRAALPTGFDPELWRGLGELGALGLRVPESMGGAGLGLFDAAMLMEEAGRTLASAPLAEGIVAAGLLARLGSEHEDLRRRAEAGEAVVTIALHDAASRPEQLVAGGSVADAVLFREGDRIFLLEGLTASGTPAFPSAPIARIRLDDSRRVLLASGEGARSAFLAAIEEWRLLMAAGLIGLSREAIRLAAQYAAERTQFGRPIGSYQAISHPLAALGVEVDAGQLLIWRAIREIADHTAGAGAAAATSYWWACDIAGRSVAQALHSFGGYGLTLEYDIHLFNLRAKAWPLVAGDPLDSLYEAGRRRFLGDAADLPDAGQVDVEFGLGDEAEALAAEVRAFFDANLTPELRAKAHHSFAGHDRNVHRKLAEHGLLFPAWPKRLGGREAGPYAREAALRVWHENGWTTNFQGTTNIVGHIIDRFGSEKLKAEALSRIVAGTAVCSLGFSEPGSGSDVFAAVTRAVPEGDGWRIDGQKMFTSGADQADYVILLARTDPAAAKHHGLTVFIVPLDAEGVTIHPVETFQDERTNVTFYDGVLVPDSCRLGEVGGGARVMAASLEIEHGMSFSKEHRALLAAAEALCRETVRDGRPMIEDPQVLTRLARVAANVSASEMLHFRTLWSIAEKRPGNAFGPASKMFSSEAYRADAAALLDMTAPQSLLSDSPAAVRINESYRHSQVTTVYGGTSEIHRSVIAEKSLGLPRTR